MERAVRVDFSVSPTSEQWIWKALEETCEIVLGQSPPSSTFNTQGDGLPFYQGKAEFGELYPSPRRWCSEPKKIAQAGDVLISVRAPVGPTNLCRESSCIGRGLAALRPKAGVCGRYVLYFLRHVERDWANRASGTTFAAISAKVLRRQRIPLAPLAEQQRIVAAIERRFAQLDAALTALKRAQVNLKRYKAAVLKAACGERRAERLAGRETGAEGLPEGWVWTTLGHVIERIEAGRSPRALGRPARRGEFGVLKVSALSWGRFRAEENKALLPGDAPGHTPTARAGDLLISRAGTRTHVGTAVMVERDYAHLMLSDKTLRLVPAESVLPRYLLYALKSPGVRDFCARMASGTSGAMHNISQVKLRATPIPLPPLAEQGRIVEEVGRRFSGAEALDDAVASGLVRAERLRRAILGRAFTRGY